MPFCNLYWKCSGKKPTRVYLFSSYKLILCFQLLEIKNHKVPVTLEDTIFHGNKFELNVLKKFLGDKKLSLKYVFDNMLKNVLDKGEFKYKVDKSIMANINSQCLIFIFSINYSLS